MLIMLILIKCIYQHKKKKKLLLQLLNWTLLVGIKVITKIIVKININHMRNHWKKISIRSEYLGIDYKIMPWFICIT